MCGEQWGQEDAPLNGCRGSLSPRHRIPQRISLLKAHSDLAEVGAVQGGRDMRGLGRSESRRSLAFFFFPLLRLLWDIFSQIQRHAAYIVYEKLDFGRLEG